MIANKADFMFGPPYGTDKKIAGVHRDAVIPKLAPRIEIFAKKLRDSYLREGSLSEQKTIIAPLRERQPEDTITKSVQTKKFIPGVIKARDEFEDIDLVFPWRTPFTMMRDEHTYMKPYYIKYKDEEIRVNLH